MLDIFKRSLSALSLYFSILHLFNIDVLKVNDIDCSMFELSIFRVFDRIDFESCLGDGDRFS